MKTIPKFDFTLPEVEASSHMGGLTNAGVSQTKVSNERPIYFEQLANESKPKSYLIDHDARELAAAS